MITCYTCTYLDAIIYHGYSQTSRNSWILRIRLRENYYRLIPPDNCIRLASEIFLHSLHRYTSPIKSPECGWFATYFYRISTRIRHIPGSGAYGSLTRNTRILSVTRSTDRNKYRLFHLSFRVIDAERRLFEINKDANGKNKGDNFSELLYIIWRVNLSRSTLVLRCRQVSEKFSSHAIKATKTRQNSFYSEFKNLKVLFYNN